MKTPDQVSESNKQNKLLSGIMFMLVQSIAMSVLYITSKMLTHTFHVYQVTFLYKLAILLAVLPWCIKGGIKRHLSTNMIGMHVTRGTFSVMGSVCFFHALSKVEVLDAVAITYMEQILIILIGVFYFREKFSSTKVLFVLLSFLGMLMILKPGFREFNRNYVFIFMALIFWAVNNFAIKVLCKTEHTKTQLFYAMLVSCILSFPMALHVWKPIETGDIKYIGGSALCYLIHLIAFFKAFKYADISTVMPFDYSRLIFTGILGYIFFKESPDQYSYIGYGMIVISGLFFMRSETRKYNKMQNQSDKNSKIVELESKYEHV